MATAVIRTTVGAGAATAPLPRYRKADAIVFVAWRDLRFAKGRFALMGTVVTLMTLLVVLLSGLTAGLGRGSTSAISDLPADHLVFSAPADGQKLSFTESTVTREQWLRWQAVPGVTGAAPLGIATTRVSVGDRSAALSAFGVPPGSGLAPDALAAGQAVLSQEAADALGAGPGQTVFVGGRPLKIAAVAGDASHSHTPVIWTDLADWQSLAPGADGDAATVVALTTTRDVDLAAADRQLRTHTVTRSAALSAIGSYTAENGSLQLMRGMLFAISALVIGAFFTVWTIQRAADIAVLKALGASTGHLLRDALGQALVLLLAGTAAGTALAVTIGAAAAGTVPFALTAGSVLFPAAVMIALGATGAALSIRRITSVDPLIALGSAR
ncbi:ABC transporter permease [Micromonospora peucetia]|uniref:ABC transporter permease n=1 Tax=Micromonospora peucetia TaxID=47871 RepID=A0A1C6W253_9ACTN|nr:ABC transporter permease [Micromonospora peucetia]WSA32023.1 ABC transporter permease [Micromonospora peucetia]SCL72592.1 putative ABC transport system permease protein [Micromonospora peucetia]